MPKSQKIVVVRLVGPRAKKSAAGLCSPGLSPTSTHAGKWPALENSRYRAQPVLSTSLVVSHLNVYYQRTWTLACTGLMAVSPPDIVGRDRLPQEQEQDQFESRFLWSPSEENVSVTG